MLLSTRDEFLGISFYLQLVLALILAFSIVVELHAYFIKTTSYKDMGAQALAYANWVIYVARILNMVFAFFLALSWEYGFSLQLSIIFALGFFLGTVLSILYLLSRRLEGIINAVLWPVLFIPFRSFRYVRFWRETHNVISRRWLAMFMTAGMAYMALLVPFFVARMLPEYRMSAVYVGQAFNFASTLVLLTAVEPRMMLSLDDAGKAGKKAQFMDGFIYSRIFVTGIFCLSSLYWLLA